MPNIYTLSVSSGLGIRPVSAGYSSPISVSVSSGLGIQPVATYAIYRNLVVSVGSGLGLQPVATETAIRTYKLLVSSGLGLSASPSITRAQVYLVSVSSALGVQAVLPIVAANRNYLMSVSSGFGLSALASYTRNQVYKVGVTTGLSVQALASLNSIRGFTVSSGLGIQVASTSVASRALSVSSGLGVSASAISPKTFSFTVSSGLGLSPSGKNPNPLYGFTVISGLGFNASVTAVKGNPSVSSGLGLSAVVTCVCLVSQYVGDPGASSSGGPAIALFNGISGSYPFTFAETSSGVVLMANGVDPTLKWDSLSGQADFAGVQAPTTAPTLTASGLGTITGTRYAAVRYVDTYGNLSNLSPLGVVQCGHDQSIDDITLNATTGLVTVQARQHGLTTGTALILQGVSGLHLNGTYSITVVDQDHFSLNGVILTAGNFLGGGAIVLGVSQIQFSAIPVPSQGKVSQIQLLRNLEGNLDVLYVDLTIAIGTAAVSATSGLLDDQLAQMASVTLRTNDGVPHAFRYGVPPSRPYIVNYLGRIWAAGDATYYAGNVSTVVGQSFVTGVGTQWTSSMIGRTLYVNGAKRPYGISGIDVVNQILSLNSTFADASNPFATYTIRSSPQDRKIIQWSEADFPEAWAPWNALAIPEDNDEITGIFVLGTYLFVAEKRHIWKIQFAGDPARGSHAFLAAMRGAINHRCIAQVDDGCFIMDESGVYLFSGDAPENISEPVQTAFQSDGLSPTWQIDWTQDQLLWHASADPIRTTIRWFVAVQGETPLTTALCYNYRLRRWWWEQYPTRITSSCTGTLAEAPNVGISAGHRRALVGSECRTVLCLGERALDIVEDIGTLRGSVGSATSYTLTDSTASYAPALGGAPVSIVSGTGAGQTRIISSVSGTTISVVSAWSTIPDTTSTYQIGGVSWDWVSGWLDVEDEEGDTNRDFAVSYQPLTSTTSLAVQFFYDHSATPEAFAAPFYKDGVSILNGDSNIYFDLTAGPVLPGWRYFRQAQHTESYAYDDRFIQIYLSGVSNDQVVRIYQVSLRGVDQDGL